MKAFAPTQKRDGLHRHAYIVSCVFSAGVLLVPVTLELYTEWMVAISKQSTSQLTLRRTCPRKLNMHPVPPLPNSFVFVSFCLELVFENSAWS